MNRYVLLAAATAIATACSGGTRDNGSGRSTAAATAGGATSSSGTRSATLSGADLTGAGSSFAYPIYSRWAADYAPKTGVHVNYQSIGSSGGIRQLSEGVVDFGATDGPMTDQQLANAKGGAVLHIPTVLGAVSITYNLPELKQPLRLTGSVLADIYLGTITKWNDARITALNPGVQLPARDIVVAHRSDGSGTSYIFTDYLSTVSPRWLARVGRGQSLGWPVGLGSKGSEGVSGSVKHTPGAIGYVELSYATQNKLPSALIQNAAGAWVAPTLASVTAAASGAAAKLTPSSDYRISIVNAPGKDAYPISSFTWIILYRNQKDAKKGKALVDFIRWGLTEGEKAAPSLDYAPLPSSMVDALQQRLNTVSIGGGA